MGNTAALRLSSPRVGSAHLLGLLHALSPLLRAHRDTYGAYWGSTLVSSSQIARLATLGLSETSARPTAAASHSAHAFCCRSVAPPQRRPPRALSGRPQYRRCVQRHQNNSHKGPLPTALPIRALIPFSGTPRARKLSKSLVHNHSFRNRPATILCSYLEADPTRRAGRRGSTTEPRPLHQRRPRDLGRPHGIYPRRICSVEEPAPRTELRHLSQGNPHCDLVDHFRHIFDFRLHQLP